jgi:hypothetical protein
MFSKDLKLHHHGGSIMVVIPADIVRHFRLVKGRCLNMAYDHQDEKLVIDLKPTPEPKYPANCPGAPA